MKLRLLGIDRHWLSGRARIAGPKNITLPPKDEVS
jgi:hypothetical protein